MRRRIPQILAVTTVACALLVALSSILLNRAQQPGSYPAFSSYRTLPEGASILYEALRHIPGMTADRNIQPLSAAHFNNAAILLLGVPFSQLSAEDVEELASQGNRVIVGLLPVRNRWIQPDKDQPSSSLERWDIGVAFFRETDFRDEKEDALTSGWPMYFSQSKGWETLRTEYGKPVVIQRKQGKGTVVLMANSFLFSNAAMVEDRQTTFLTTLIGPVHQTIFDETHFGIEETGSIAALARRYRLQGLVLGLVLVASLFIWKNAAGFPPVAFSNMGPNRMRTVQSVTGEDSASAFLNLLRRNIRRDDILSTCVEEWRKMYQRQAGSKVQVAVDLAESGRKTPAQTYAQIQQIIGAKQNPS